MTEHADRRSDLIAIIHDVRRRWRIKLALRGAALATGSAAAALVALGVGLQWMRFTPRLDPAVPDRHGGAWSRCSRTPCSSGRCCAGSATSRWRSISRSTSRRSKRPSSARLRADARTAARRCRRHWRASWCRPRWKNAARDRRRPPRRADPAPPLFGRARRRCSRSRRSSSCSAPPTCATRCRRCSSSRAASRRRHHTDRRDARRQDHSARRRPGRLPRGCRIPGRAGRPDVRKSSARPPSTGCRSSASRRTNYEPRSSTSRAAVEYFVEAAGVSSPVYNLKVADMPYVQHLELEYHFPAYTGLAAAQDRGRRRHRRFEGHRNSRPRRDDDGRRGGRLVIDDKTQVPMAVRPTAR